MHAEAEKRELQINYIYSNDFNIIRVRGGAF